MPTLWYKIWADLRLAKTRSLLAILSICAGVFCVGTLFGMIDLQLSKMDAAHKNSQPSHINLILRGFADNGLLAQIKAVPGVADVDILTPISIRFRRIGATEWNLGTLIIRAGPSLQKFDKTSLISEHWPAAGKIAIENLSASSARISPGDSIEFETAAGLQTLEIDSMVRHPFVKPPAFGGQIHFFADLSSAGLFAVPEASFRQLLVRVTQPYQELKAGAVAKEIRSLLLKHGHAVNVTLLQDPEKHWGRPFLAGINRVLHMMSLVALGLASVIILNTLAARITQQITQIGVLKSLGAGIGIILQMYFAETILLALLAIGLALPLSLASSYFSSCHLLGLFNIDCGDFSYSIRAIQLMCIGGLLAPILAALGPVLRGASVNVRVALSSYGLGGDFGYSRFDLWIEQLGLRFLPTLYAAAFGNLFRRKGSFCLTQSVLIIAGVMFLVLMSLIASLDLTLNNEMARSRYAVRLGFPIDQPETQVLEIATSLPETKYAEVWQRLPLEISRNGGVIRQKGSLGGQLLALPAASTMYQPLLESGRWLQAADAGRRVLVLSAETAELNGIQAGEWVKLKIGADQQSWQVIGLYRWLVGNKFAIEPAYAPLETVRALTRQPDSVSFVLLNARIDTLTEEFDYVRSLKQGFQNQGIPLDVFTTESRLEQRQFARNQFKPMIATLSGLACMIAVVGGIGLSGALAISVLQRTREIGMLRAIGASATTIFRLFCLEGLLHGFIAWLLSVPLAYLAAEPVSKELGETMLSIKLDFCFDRRAVFYWLLLVLVLAWVAAYWPARKAAKISVRECLVD